MARRTLSLATLTDLDLGKVDLTVKAELKKIVADIADRPQDERPRKLLIGISVTPEEIEHGEVEVVAVGFAVKTVLPQQETRTHMMRVGAGHQLMFESESPDNPDQKTIDELVEGTVDERTGEVRATRGVARE